MAAGRTEKKKEERASLKKKRFLYLALIFLRFHVPPPPFNFVYFRKLFTSSAARCSP